MKKTFIAVLQDCNENDDEFIMQHVGWLAWHTADAEFTAEHCGIKEDFITTKTEDPIGGAAIEIDDELPITCASVKNRMEDIYKRNLYFLCPMTIDIVCEEDDEE